MNLKPIYFLLIVVFCFSCKKETYKLLRIEGTRIEINDSLSENKEIDSFIKPFREHLNKNIDSVLAYSVETYSKDDGELNTAIGNLMVDIIFSQANPVFQKKTGNNIDLVLMNHGGIRSELPKGNVTIRTAYELMPFENSLVVVGLKGEKIDDIISYLIAAKRAHPFLGLKIIIDKDFNLIDAKINGEKIDPNRIYHVATNDYLFYGGDNMTFFQPNESFVDLDYKIRNAIIDYFIKTDTIKAKIDDRFMKQQ